MESENSIVKLAFELLDENYVGNITLDDFKWALAVVISRCFNSADESNNLELVPLADMLNHENPANVTKVVSQKTFLSLKT